MAPPTVAIIGAGIVGASVAYNLVNQGASVHLIDRGEPGRGTTSTSFAWLNANQKTPRAYFDLNLAGMAEHRALADTLRRARWYHPDGNLCWANEDGLPELRERVARLQEWGYEAEWIDARAANAELEPGAAFPDPLTPVAWFPDEGWIDAPALTQRLLSESRLAGATIMTETAVTAIERIGGRIAGVTLSSGERIAADVVVNAAGVDAQPIAELAGSPLPVAPVAGMLLRLGHPGNPLRRILHTPVMNVRPDGRDYLILQAADLDERLGDRREIRPSDPLIGEILARGVAGFPALSASTLAEVRIGIRPIPADGYPSTGQIDPADGYVEAVTHSGVTLGPLLGRLIATEILTGDVDPLLAPFRSSRFRVPTASSPSES